MLRRSILPTRSGCRSRQSPASHPRTTPAGRARTRAAERSDPEPAALPEQAAFDNPHGGNDSDFGPVIQFDTKGVEFGPWIRRFMAQVKRNWFVPYAAMSLRGHVVITFNVHKTGALTEVTVVGPSGDRRVQHRRVQRAR